MSKLRPIIDVIDLASKLLEAYQHWDEGRPDSFRNQKSYDEIWSQISRIAAENAASPEIQGYSEH